MAVNVLIRSSGRAISGGRGRCQLLRNIFTQSATDFRPILTEFRFSRQIFVNAPCIKFNGNSSSGSRPVQFKYLGITLRIKILFGKELRAD